MNTGSNDDVPTHPDSRARLERVESVFHEVSDLPPAERGGAISRLCAGDEALATEVRSLLAVEERMDGFLERPALGIGIDQLAADPNGAHHDTLVGTTLGAFRLESRIASGGMGTVYLAVRNDGQFEQRVAIKVVKRGMDSEEILQRFRIERQTLAALDHPNIARLIDGGATPDGRPFLVMEYVDGKPIDEYCDQLGLGLRDRIRLFQHVCVGVHHAHQNLIIHRDLKPSNILVTSQGVPKLLDFGIAKLLAGDGTDSSGSRTAETDRRLTPEFASPEQFDGGPLTTASDVYSLGVVLYELLTGTRPYSLNARSNEEARRVVCLQPPLPPSEAITVRASRLRNIESTPLVAPQAPAVHEPPAPTPSTRSDVDVPRTRGVSSTRLRSLLRGDLDIIVLMALRKEPQRRYVSAEQFSADLGRYLSGLPVQARRDTLAYRASKFVRRHALAVGTTAVAVGLLAGEAGLLYQQRQALRAQQQALLSTNHRLDESVRRLDSNRRFLQAIISGADSGNQGPDARLGDILRDAATTLRTAPPQDPLTLAASQEAAGRAMMSLGMLDEAQPLLEAAHSAHAGRGALDDARLDSAHTLAQLAFFRGQFDQAERQLRGLLADEIARAGDVPTARRGSLLNDLGAAIRAQDRAAEAVQIQREALTVRITVHGGDSLEVAETRNNLASALLQSGKVAPAAEEFARVLAIRTLLLRPEHPLIVRCQSNLGLAQLRLGNTTEAIALLQQSVRSWERAFGPEHDGRILAAKSLAQALRQAGKRTEALTTLREALAWQQAHQPDRASSIAATEANIGLVLLDEGRDSEAMEVLARVLPLLQAAPNLASITRQTTESLATLYERNGREPEALRLRESLKAP